MPTPPLGATGKTAVNCPPIVVPGAFFDPDSDLPTVSSRIVQWTTGPDIITASRQAAGQTDMGLREGAGGGYGICEGLDIIDVVSAGIRIKAGVASIDGPRVLKALPNGAQSWVPNPNTLGVAGIIPWVDNQTNYCWLMRDKTLTKVLGSLTPPVGAAAFLGLVTMASGVATLDGSGVLYRRWGGPWERATADVGVPGDTPPASLCFLQHSLGSGSDVLYWWDGTAYRELVYGGAVRDPVVDKDPANKAYVDAALAGATDAKDSVRVVTAAALPAYTRSGNVITATANAALAAVDGVTLALNDRLLLKNGAAGADNGLYYVSQVGDGSNPYKLTRTTDADTSGEVTAGLYVFATEGTAHANSGWLLVTTGSITLNTTALDFTQVAGFPAILGGAGLSKTGSTLDVNVDGTTLQIASDVVGVKAGGIDPTHLSFDPATQAELDALLISHAGTPEAAVTATPGTLCEDTTNGALYLKVTGSGNTGWQQLKSAAALLPYSDSTAATVFNTTVEGTFSPSPTAFAGGSLKAGQVLKYHLWGVYGQAALPATLRARVYMGSVLLLDTGALSGFVTVANKGWRAEVEIRINNAGASGSVEAQGILSFATAAGAALAAHVANTAAVTGIDFTASQQLSVSVQWGTADVADTITRRLQTLEVLG